MTMSSFLGENPQIAYQSSLTGMAPQRRRFWGDKYFDVYGQYQGQQGAQGGIPTGDFSSFLGNYPWLQEYQSYSPYQRGVNYSRYSPATRMLQY